MPCRRTYWPSMASTPVSQENTLLPSHTGKSPVGSNIQVQSGCQGKGAPHPLMCHLPINPAPTAGVNQGRSMSWLHRWPVGRSSRHHQSHPTCCCTPCGRCHHGASRRSSGRAGGSPHHHSQSGGARTQGHSARCPPCWARSPGGRRGGAGRSCVPPAS